MKIIGIDMTQTEKPCSLVILDEFPKVVETIDLVKDKEIAQFCVSADLVAIDSPLFLPLGLCCLEETCACQPQSDKNGRECERQMSKMGIPSYYTTKKTFIKPMIYRSIELYRQIADSGVKVIEIYPRASSRQLFGKMPKKTTPLGFSTLIRKISMLVAGIEKIKTHDQADAFLGAYTGWLMLHDQAQAVGSTDEGYVWLPNPRFAKPQKTVN